MQIYEKKLKDAVFLFYNQFLCHRSVVPRYDTHKVCSSCEPLDVDTFFAVDRAFYALFYNLSTSQINYQETYVAIDACNGDCYDIFGWIRIDSQLGI